MTKEEYNKHPGISNSMMSYILPESGGSVRKYKMKTLFPEEVSEEETKAMELGTQLHLILEKESMDHFAYLEIYPSPGIKSICDIVYKLPAFAKWKFEFDATAESQVKDDIAETASKLNFQSGWKRETIINKVLAEGLGYMVDRFASDLAGITLVSRDRYKELEAMYGLMRETAPQLFTSDLNEFYMNEHKYEVIREKPLFGVSLGMQIKCRIDKGIINHTTKTIQLYDLKTTHLPLPMYLGYDMDTYIEDKSGVEHVPGKYLDWGVHRQLSLYSQILKQNYSDYLVIPNILAVQTTQPYDCELHTIPKDQIYLGQLRWERALMMIDQNNLDAGL